MDFVEMAARRLFHVARQSRSLCTKHRDKTPSSSTGWGVR